MCIYVLIYAQELFMIFVVVNSMKKKIKKGLTLMELVIAMALSSVVIGGAVVVFLSMNKLSQTQTKTNSELFDAKGLVIAVDSILSSSSNKEIVMNTSGTPQGLLFTITENDDSIFAYNFSGTVLEKTNTTSGTTEEVLTTDELIRVSITSAGLNGYKLSFEYGQDFENTFYLIKKVN